MAFQPNGQEVQLHDPSRHDDADYRNPVGPWQAHGMPLLRVSHSHPRATLSGLPPGRTTDGEVPHHGDVILKPHTLAIILRGEQGKLLDLQGLISRIPPIGSIWYTLSTTGSVETVDSSLCLTLELAQS